MGKYTQERNIRAQFEIELKVLEQALSDTWDCVAKGKRAGDTCPRDFVQVNPAVDQPEQVHIMQLRSLKSQIARLKFTNLVSASAKLCCLRLNLFPFRY